MNAGRAIVVGLAASGLAAGRLLQRQGWRVVVSERRAESAVEPLVLAQARAAGWECHFGGHDVDVLASGRLVVLSPGVPACLPELAECRRRGIPVIGEVELAGRCLRGRLVTVTGTKGKSSTVAVLAAILGQAGDIDFEVGGHAGLPLSACDPDRALVVAELACYQMEALDTFCPDIHVVTNVFPDHQDRYPDFAAYFDLKTRLCRAQQAGQCSILPAALLDWATGAGLRGRVLAFSGEREVAEGAWLDAGRGLVHCRLAGKRRRFTLPPGVLRGHGENILAAVLAALEIGVGEAAIAAALAALRAPRHRLQVIHDDGYVRLVDDGACNNGPALRHLLSSLDGAVRLLTLNGDEDLDLEGGRVCVTRLQREGLEQALAPALRAQLGALPAGGGTVAWAPGVPVRADDPQAYLELFATAAATALGCPAS